METRVYRYDYPSEELARRVFEKAHATCASVGESSFWLIRIVSEPAKPWAVVMVDDVGAHELMDWEGGVRNELNEQEVAAFIGRRRTAQSGSLGAFDEEGALRNTIEPGTPVSIGDGEFKIEPIEPTDDYAEFLRAIKDGVRAEVDAYDTSQEDFDAKLILQNATGAIMFVEIGPLVRSETTKNYLGEVLMPGLIRHHEASRAAFVSSAWMSVVEASDEDAKAAIKAWRDAHDGNLEGGPGVGEYVTGWVGDFTGAITNVTAELIREEGKPLSLGEWQPTEVWQFGDMTEGPWPRLQGDAMLALMGSPTSIEVRAAIKVIGNDPFLLDRLAEHMVRLGIDPTVSEEEFKRRSPDILAEMRKDEEFEQWFRDYVKELIGDGSPIRRG